MLFAALTFFLDLRGASPNQPLPPNLDGLLLDAAAALELPTATAPAFTVEDEVLWCSGQQVGVAVQESSPWGRNAINEAIRRPEKNLLVSADLLPFALAQAQHCRSISGCETRLLCECRRLGELDALKEAARADDVGVPLSALLPLELWDFARHTSQLEQQPLPDGAGVPRPSLAPDEVPSLLMNALRFNDFPETDAGLRAMWAFAGDTTRFLYQNNMTEFIEDAHETAESLPTSFYGMAMLGNSVELEGQMNMVGGADDAWIATQIVKTVASDGRMRRWQWELRKHRRPPNLGAWYVESVGSSDRLGNFDVAG